MIPFSQDTSTNNSPVGISKISSPIDGNLTPPRSDKNITPSSDDRINNSPANFIQIKKTFQGDETNKTLIKSTPERDYADIMKQTGSISVNYFFLAANGIDDVIKLPNLIL